MKPDLQALSLSPFESTELEMENQEWRDAFAALAHEGGSERAIELLYLLEDQARQLGIRPPDWRISDDDKNFQKLAAGLEPSLRERYKREIEDAMTELPSKVRAASVAFNEMVEKLEREAEHDVAR